MIIFRALFRTSPTRSPGLWPGLWRHYSVQAVVDDQLAIVFRRMLHDAEPGIQSLREEFRRSVLQHGAGVDDRLLKRRHDLGLALEIFGIQFIPVGMFATTGLRGVLIS